MRREGIGFDDDYDRAGGGFDGVGFACVEYASHAGVDVDSHRQRTLEDGGGYRMNLVLIRPKIASAAFQSN